MKTPLTYVYSQKDMSRKEGLAKHIKRVHKDATFFEWTDEGVLDDHPPLSQR